MSGNVSLVDLTVNLTNATSLPQIMDAFQAAALGGMKRVLHVEHEQLVSCDFQGNSHSAVIDAKACLELNSKVAPLL
jgi:glyceraldehyde 3-phosphate dehydrogenase